jgi:predicted transcriptional regulator
MVKNIDRISKSLTENCWKVLTTLSRNDVLSPSQISNQTNIHRRSVDYCLNNLVEAGLVIKLERGAYKISGKGRRMVELFTQVLAESEVYVWDDDGFHLLDYEYIGGVLRPFLSDEYIGKYHFELNEQLKTYGVVSKEFMITMLCSLLVRDGFTDICKELSSTLVYMGGKESKPYFSRVSLYRKVLESISPPSILSLFRNRVFQIDHPSTIEKLHLLYSFDPEEYPQIDSEVFKIDVLESIFSEDVFEIYSGIERFTKMESMTINSTINESLSIYNDIIRELKEHGVNITLVLHVGDDKSFFEDPLILNMLLNNLKMGIEILLVKEKYYRDRLVSREGFSVSNKGVPTIYVPTISYIYTSDLLKEPVESTMLRGLPMTVIRYGRWKTIGLEEALVSAGFINFIIFYIDREYEESEIERIIEYYKMLYNYIKEQGLVGDFEFGVSSMVIREDLIDLFSGFIPPLSSRVFDPMDLKITINKFLQSRYPSLKLRV